MVCLTLEFTKKNSAKGSPLRELMKTTRMYVIE